MQHTDTKDKWNECDTHSPYPQSAQIKIPYQERHMLIDGFIDGIAYKSYPDMQKSQGYRGRPVISQQYRSSAS